MFTNFFFTLKRKKIPVSMTEWMTLMEALSKGCITNLDEFYYLGRAILVKDESNFDKYDVAFSEYFRGIETEAEINDQIIEWLKNPLDLLGLSDEERQAFEKMSLDDLMNLFEQRLKEQTEQHDGGSRWIGRGGVSPFGHSGRRDGGIRVGGESRNRSAVKVAQERRYATYRSDVTLDTRQIKIALRGLRQLVRTGSEDTLDIEETIDATAQNAGELEFIWSKSRKNSVKVLLLMDASYSMVPYARLCSQLFSAAHSSNHFKDMQYYYFYNCIYDSLYKDTYQREHIETESLMKNFERDYKVIFVGDARMAPSELMDRYGSISYYEQNATPGFIRLKQLADHFPHSVWLNPDDQSYWNHYTVLSIGKVFPMFPLTIDGLEQAIKKLIKK